MKFISYHLVKLGILIMPTLIFDLVYITSVP
jgi:hypothetical protein